MLIVISFSIIIVVLLFYFWLPCWSKYSWMTLICLCYSNCGSKISVAPISIMHSIIMGLALCCHLLSTHGMMNHNAFLLSAQNIIDPEESYPCAQCLEADFSGPSEACTRYPCRGWLGSKMRSYNYSLYLLLYWDIQ